MFPTVRCALRAALPALLAFAVAAAAPVARGADEPVDEAQQSFKKASKSLKRGYYDDAITEFEKLRNKFPFSRYAVDAELKIADALFKKHEYVDAADAYRTFAKLHPKHEKVDYASYRVGLSMFQDSPRSVDRDQVGVEKALEEFRAFITRFPDSKYAADAAKRVGEGRDRLAEKELYVGRYYVKHRKYKASLGRLRNVLAKYPESTAVEEASFLLGKALYHTRAHGDARTQLTAFLRAHPSSRFAREARKLLARLGQAPPAAAEPGPASTPAPATTAAPTGTPAPTESPK